MQTFILVVSAWTVARGFGTAPDSNPQFRVSARGGRGRRVWHGEWKEEMDDARDEEGGMYAAWPGQGEAGVYDAWQGEAPWYGEEEGEGEKEEEEEAVFDSTSEEEKEEEEKAVFDSTSKIAIIGGGVSGIFSALELKKQGYKHVVVYEAEPEVAALTVSHTSKTGSLYDLSTAYLPLGLDVLGEKPAITSLFEQYGVEVEPMPKFQWMFSANPRSQTFLEGPHVFTDKRGQRLAGSLVLSNLLQGFRILQEVATFDSMVECQERFGQNVTWLEFSRQVNLPAWTRLSSFMTDIMLSGPSVDESACYTLMLRADWMASTIASILYQGGLTSDAKVDPVLQRLLADPMVQQGQTRLYVPSGYKNFFKALVEQENLDVRVNSRIRKFRPKKNGKGVKLWISGQKKAEKFDAVIISSRPKDTLAFLPKRNDAVAEARDLLSKVGNNEVETFLVKYEEATHLKAPFAVGLYPQLGAIALPKANFSSIKNGLPIGVQALEGYEKNHLIAMSYTDDHVRRATSKKNLLAGLGMAGITKPRIKERARFDYVVKAPMDKVAQGFHGQFERLQGYKRVFFVGEALAGPGVPAQLSFVSNYVPKWFPEVQPREKRKKNRRKNRKDFFSPVDIEALWATWEDPWALDDSVDAGELSKRADLSELGEDVLNALENDELAELLLEEWGN